MINIKQTIIVSALSLGLVVGAAGLAVAATSNHTNYTTNGKFTVVEYH